MARLGDHGAYEVGNAYITSAIDNCSDAPRKRKHDALPLGVQKRKNRYLASRMLNGVIHRLGAYDTPEEAHAAYMRLSPVPESLAA